jgi:hypothetical protein
VTVDALVARAEVLKLARVLGTEPDRLAYLEAAPPAALAELRQQVTDLLFDGESSGLRRIADAGRIVPVPVMASIGEHAFGPLLCARLTGLLDPDRAAAVGRRLPAPFLAAVAAELDPRRASDVIGRMPLETTVAVARILTQEGEWVAMGRFVAFLDGAALAACVEVMDDAALLRTAYVLEGKDRLDDLIGLLPDERLAAVIDVTAEEELWPETLDLLAHLGDAQLDRLGRLSADGDPAAYAGLAAVAREHGAEAVLDRARAHGLRIPPA